MLETIPNTKFKAAGRASPQKGRPGRNPAAILKSENGDVNYFSTVVFIFIAVLLLAFILDLFSIISTKQELDHCADQMVKQIQLSEGINGETEQLFNFLCSQIEGAENISYSIDASYKSPTPSGMSRAIQLGTPFYITITGRAKLGGFWNFNLVNITVVSRGAGVSEHYWRRMKMKQNLQVPSKVRAQHLNREALVYVRQSTMAQVRFNQESTQRQYALRERALLLGWPEEHIRVIDGDLGISGSGRSKRPGFAQLVTSVSLGEVGAVLGLEISRLARSSADLMKLLELCGLFGTLVIDEDGIYDMSDFNDRLLIGLKGTMGEAELHFLHARMIGGKENAASRGELRFPLPVGYIYDASGRTIMDPDEGVQHALSTLFQAFRTSGSAYGIVRYFAENNLSFPKRAYGGAWDGKVTWGTLTHSRVLGVIHNPAYAGAYVYGRYRDNKTIDADGHFEHHPVRLPDKEDWKVFLPGHHQAYISWEEFEENQKRLASNQTNMERRGPAREGAALLTGVLLCGKCGRRMTVRYTGTGGICPLYECIGRWEHGNKATCSSVPARALDQAVSEKILSIMKPSELEISLKVMRSINDADRMSDKQWLLSVERAQYEADRAERQFMLADPENRLVVRSLEANWNQKLKELEKAKQDYAIYSSKKAWIPSEKEEQDILNLAQKIPEIWNAPTSTPKEKKRIVRILIDDITVLAEKRCPDFGVGIRFRSGKCEQLSLKKNLPYGDRRRHTDSTISRIHELAAALIDPGIADRLNQDGYVTPEGKPFTYAGVRWIRYKYDISGPYERNRQGISVAEAAGLLDISADRVYYGISVGKIPARKQHQGWPWEVLIDDSNLESIKALYT